MKDVVVIGAGKIGATVAGLLASTGDYQVTLADRPPEVLGNLDRDERIRIMAADVEDSLKLVDLLNGQFAVAQCRPLPASCPSWPSTWRRVHSNGPFLGVIRHFQIGCRSRREN